MDQTPTQAMPPAPPAPPAPLTGWSPQAQRGSTPPKKKGGKGKWIAGGVVVLLALAALGSLGKSNDPATPSATPTPASARVTAAPTVTATPGASALSTESPRAEEPTAEPIQTPVGTETNPVPRGTTARVGDWDVTVSGKVNFNAWKVIKAANMFNTKPPTGWVDVLIPIKVVYRGTERGNLSMLGNTTAVLGAATLTERQEFTDPTCGVAPKPLGFGSPTVRPGGKLTGNLCIVVEAADVPTLVLLWAPDLFGMDNATYFALR